MNDVVVTDAPSVAEQPDTSWVDSIDSVHSTAQKEEAQKVEETPAEEAPQPEPEKPKKKPSGYLKKLGRAEAQIEFLQQQLQQYQQPASKPEATELAEPNIADFKTYAEFNEAQRKYDRELAKKEAESVVNKKIEDFTKEAKETQTASVLAKKGQEIDQVLNEKDPSIVRRLDEMHDEGIFTVEVAREVAATGNPDLAEYLSNSREDVAAMAKMSPQQRTIAMAFIQGKLIASKSAPQEVRQTKASAPITPIKKAGSAAKSPHEMSLRELDKVWK